jgi:hypothetical protein
MVFAFLRAKKKCSPNRRLALTKNAGSCYLEIASFNLAASEAETFRELFLVPSLSWLMGYAVTLPRGGLSPTGI